MNIVAAIFVLFLGLFAFALIRPILFMLGYKHGEYAESTRSFYDAVEPIVNDDETPIEVIEIIEAFNDTITDRAMARRLFKYMSEYEWWKDRSTPSLRWKKAVEFFERRPELGLAFRKANISWFLAVTALAPFTGRLARMAMTEPGLEKTAVRIRARRNSNGQDDPTNNLPQTATA